MEATNIDLVDPVVSNCGTPETLLAWTYQAVEESTQSLQAIKAREKQQALSLYAEAIRLLVSLQEQWDKIQEHLPRQLTHGDYGGGNLLFQHEQPVAILDFDFMQIRERVFEIAYTLYWWLYKQGRGQLSAVSLWQKVKELLTSYNEGTPKPLTLEERRALPLEMAANAALPRHHCIRQAAARSAGVGDRCYRPRLHESADALHLDGDRHPCHRGLVDGCDVAVAPGVLRMMSP